jgi:chaperonin cofactor prefoldin
MIMREKSAYVEKLEKKIEELDDQIYKLREKARMAKRDAEIDLTMKIEELRDQHEDLMEKLDGLKNAGDQGWQSLKEGVEKAYDDLKYAFSDAKSKFK